MTPNGVMSSALSVESTLSVVYVIEFVEYVGTLFCIVVPIGSFNGFKPMMLIETLCSMILLEGPQVNRSW